jgi:IS5 family transposase
MRRFAGIELLGHDIPDETTILRIRHLLEQHQLTERIFAEIRSLLEEKRLLLKSGTIVDATIISAPPSTKNEQKARDPVEVMAKVVAEDQSALLFGVPRCFCTASRSSGTPPLRWQQAAPQQIQGPVSRTSTIGDLNGL